jgi:hypothetical protein
MAQRTIILKGFRGSIVGAISDSNFSKLRITRAYINLLCLPQGDVGMISLAWIGNYEVRMLDVPQTGAADEPLFLIELFDHDAQSQLDSRVCYEIEQGAAAFEAFVSRRNVPIPRELPALSHLATNEAVNCCGA